MTNPKNKFTNKVEGEKAALLLLETLGEKSLIAREEKNLLMRISKLENEFALLKDLFVRTLKVGEDAVLKD